MSTWLVTGGAGYIGAHVVKSLLENDFKVVIVDDLSTGLARKVPSNVVFEKIDIAETKKLTEIMKTNNVEGVFHLAAKKAVIESVENPSLYYRENIGGLISVLEAMSQANVKKIVYSSSCSVYGNPTKDFVNENSETKPLSPYGETKLIGELLLRADESARNIKWVALRYFNVAGSGSNELGDTGVFNLIPMVFRALENNESPKVFGNDYDTPDGSCIRDYIHVSDLAEAHLVAAKKITQEQYSGVLNIGRGEGFSVIEVMNTISEVLKKDINFKIASRRSGDPARGVADVTKSIKDLNWEAKNDLKSMVSSAWQAWQNMPAKS